MFNFQSLISFFLSIETLSPLIHVNDNTYFWLHPFEYPEAFKDEGI